MMKRLIQIAALVTLLILVDVSVAQGDSIPDEAYISGVTGHAQGYSLSCESRSAADLAAYWGVNISETEFLQALPHADNPDNGFVGNPSDAWGSTPPHSYGVNASPVAYTLKEFGLQADAHNSLSWDDLREQISAGRPVIVWVIGQMWDGTSVEYVAPDGSNARVANFEHTMILIGYSSASVQVVDAYSGTYQTYKVSTFLKSWEVLGNMAVFVLGKAEQQDNPAPESHGDSYTVQQGDYLVELAKRFGTTWQQLAELNSVAYPYTIYPGQVLKLPAKAPQEAAQATPEPAPVVIRGHFRVCLPMVERNQATPLNDLLKLRSTLPKPIKNAIALSSDTLAALGRSIKPDWQHLTWLTDLLPRELLHDGQALWQK